MYISIDLGRSTTRVASTNNLKDISEIEKFPTENRLDNQKNKLVQVLEDISRGNEVDAISFGFPGITGGLKNIVLRSANYPQMEGMDISSFFPEKFKDIKLLIENDAALGALGEAYFGAGRDKKIVSYLTLSTGVGGARVVKYEIEYEVINAEPGHMIINCSDELVDGSGLPGTFESYCAGSYFKNRYNENPNGTADIEAWKKYSANLSFGILNIISMWKPEVIVLGGGLSIHNFNIFYPLLMDELKKQTFFDIPEIRKSQMGDDSGIYGGFILLKENL